MAAFVSFGSFVSDRAVRSSRLPVGRTRGMIFAGGRRLEYFDRSRGVDELAEICNGMAVGKVVGNVVSIVAIGRKIDDTNVIDDGTRQNRAGDCGLSAWLIGIGDDDDAFRAAKVLNEVRSPFRVRSARASVARNSACILYNLSVCYTHARCSCN
jgi:hypothetical protein